MFYWKKLMVYNGILMETIGFLFGNFELRRRTLGERLQHNQLWIKVKSVHEWARRHGWVT